MTIDKVRFGNAVKPAVSEAGPAGSLFVLACIASSVEVHSALTEQAERIADVGNVLVSAYRRANKALFFGNGGSAADAQHLAAEFIGRFRRDRRALPAVALTVNTSSLTALSNDYGYDQVFARQIEALGSPGDVAIGISTSGQSPNVLEGIRTARRLGLVTVALSGGSGGQLKEETEYCIRVPSADTARIQEAHILVGHILCEIVEAALFGDPES